jgi:hypothetical protein
VTSRLGTGKSLTFFRSTLSPWFILFLILESQIRSETVTPLALCCQYVAICSVDTFPNKMHRIAGWVPVRCPEAARHIRHAKPNQIPERCPAGPSVDFLCRKGCGHVLTMNERESTQVEWANQPTW